MIFLKKFLSSFLLALACTNDAVSAGLEYPSGPCMNDAWQDGERTTSNLGCTANEITSKVVSVDGPTSCKEGEFIFVNVTTSIYFRATRYDFAIYTSTVPGGDPIFGEECALDVLGVDDSGAITGGEIKVGDGDRCYDVFGNGARLENFKFQENLKIPCQGNDDTGETRSVFLQNCFGWRSNTKGVCEVIGAYPSAVSKCDCASLNLGINIVGPTPAPSVSALPTVQPSPFPSISTNPTKVPSIMPSTSMAPTGVPSLIPSISAMPSNYPSVLPSISAEPTTVPSLVPSISTEPTTLPSLEPSISTKPTMTPSLMPSISTSPTGVPSLIPSISAMPSSYLSVLPSISAEPTTVPSLVPSISTEPTTLPSLAPSISTKPTMTPSLMPSISTSPSGVPSLIPSISAMPSNYPSVLPSISAEPTMVPSLMPSISTDPTSLPSLTPSISTKPTMTPSLMPSISTSPTGVPSLIPSISAMPSNYPSVLPSISAEPTTVPSLVPSISTEPTTLPSLAPSISTKPTMTPSLMPSISTSPSGVPSLIPSISAMPSNYPSVLPSISAEPTTVPSLVPSISTEPTTLPSLAPSISTKPTTAPSQMPSISTSPTNQPSQSPTITTAPTLRPSTSPSTSISPSIQPTLPPTISAMPTDSPSESPSITTAPSSHPTVFPSPSPSSSPTLLASIAGAIFLDKNSNGLMEGGESLLPNVPVRLYNQDGIVVKEQMSDANGRYEFENIFPGAPHTVVVVVGSGYIFSPVVAGGNQMTRYDDMMGMSPSIILDEGGFRNDVHAGVFEPTVIGNKVWDDLNGNGIQEDGEPGIGNVEVSLRDESGDVLDTVYTDAAGLYSFAGWPPRKYGVHFVLPSGYTFTKSEAFIGDIAPLGAGSLLDEINSDANIQTGATRLIDVFSGDVNLSLDAGLYRPALVEGKVWHDLNANGIQENNEPGIEGAVVSLYNDDNEYIEMATTDSSGNYAIDGLVPDTYYGKILPDGDYNLSPTSQGSEESDSDFLQNTGLNSPVTLRSGDINSGYFDAGLWVYASVGDLIWIDTSADGIQAEDPLIGFPFPVTINIYAVNDQLLSTTQNDEMGFYTFVSLMPGSYEIEFITDETEIFSPPFQGNNNELDSDVDPDTKRAQVTLVSGEINNNVDAGIITEAPYYPDWVFEEQICTNDGFDPSWMTTNDGQIYLYRNKEQCCENHFWWRVAQCMANEEYKFYRNGEICDTKIDFEDWELNSPADWTDTTLFDTKDECCANLFPYDYTGCMDRSPVIFKFEFCLELGTLPPPLDCQTADIYANVLEDAINQGLGDESDANVTRVGDATLTKVDGSTQCGGSLDGQDFINDLTGTPPDLNAPFTSTSICGVITTESYDCTQDDCLNAMYDSIATSLNFYINGGDLTATLHSLSTTRLPPVPQLQVAIAEPGTLNTFNILLPTTMSDQLGELKYAKDNQQCITKTAFAVWEEKYDSLQDCCQASFSWRFDACCDEGGGCNSVSEPPTGPATTHPLKFYANWVSRKLCNLKPFNEFENWEQPFDSLDDCCNKYFSYDIAGCCQSEGMGGCDSVENPLTMVATTATSPPVTTVTGATVVASTTTGVTPTIPSSVKYYATWIAGQLCADKPATTFQSWEQPFDSLEECCNEKFLHDIDGCCASEGMGGCGRNSGEATTPPPLRYYATWKRGQLCDAKYAFEDWEQPFDSLHECCAEHFSYGHDDCCQSSGMGGCV